MRRVFQSLLLGLLVFPLSAAAGPYVTLSGGGQFVSNVHADWTFPPSNGLVGSPANFGYGDEVTPAVGWYNATLHGFDMDFEAGWNGALALGYQWKHWGVEFEATYTGNRFEARSPFTFDLEPTPHCVEVFSIPECSGHVEGAALAPGRLDLWMFMTGVSYSWPLKGWMPFVAVGAGPVLARMYDVTLRAEGVRGPPVAGMIDVTGPSFHDTRWTYGGQFKAGVAVPLSGHLELVVSYAYAYVAAPEFDFGEVDVEMGNLQMHMGQVGLRWGF